MDGFTGGLFGGAPITFGGGNALFGGNPIANATMLSQPSMFNFNPAVANQLGMSALNSLANQPAAQAPQFMQIQPGQIAQQSNRPRLAVAQGIPGIAQALG